LPGCTTTVPAAPDGRPPRRYCTPEHHVVHRAGGRSAATAATVAAPSLVASSEAAPVVGAPDAASSDAGSPNASAAASPVAASPVARHSGHVSSVGALLDPSPISAASPVAGIPDVASTGAAVAVAEPSVGNPAVDAAPAPAVETTPRDGEPSRVDAGIGRERPAAVRTGAPLVVDTLTGLPSTREPRRRRRIDVSAEDHEAFQRWKATRAARARRTRRLAAIVGAAGVLAAAGTFVVKELPDRFDPDHVPRVVARADWQSQARIALTSIDTQLDSISAAQAVWDKEIAASYDGRIPAEVAAMLARKTLLEQQRAALQGQLATAEQLAHARTLLAGVDRQLAEIDTTLASLPRGALNPDQQFVRDSLAARRGLLVEERSARSTDVSRLQEGVAVAERSPVPDPADQTEPLTRRVLDLRDRTPVPPPPPQAPPPAATAPDRRDPTVLADSGAAPSEPSRGARAVAAARPPVEIPVLERSSGDDSSGGGSSGGSAGSGGSSREPADPGRDTEEPSGSPAGRSSRGGSDDGGSGGSGGSSGSGGSTGSSGSGGSDGSGGSGMTPQQAYEWAMNTPGGRMNQYIRSASGG